MVEDCEWNTFDPDNCTRRWGRSEKPVEILAEAIKSKTFKWCYHETDFGEVENGLTATATEDDVDILQDIQACEFYGSQVSWTRSVTIQMSNILHKELKHEIFVVKAKDFFSADILNAMAKDECFASLDYVIRHPNREALADFTCPAFLVSGDYGILVTESSQIEPEAIVESNGSGYRMCAGGEGGTTQEALENRDFPDAEKIDVGNVSNSAQFLC
uniref:Uncharacterized protein n=1 Tax=Pseudictyota dubia TaxID=2749911 RepID=A0A7R9W6L4_9STRA|mmetsp:Transcript_33974/g.62919  ORF Transcript_33974/g.62919 Transcript_33974/m.62919 type:complete len:216 (+) Transcript_33974:401-1048(+)|eukprot:CAMPEP_0197448192 /NCGR_PEP_ID=MMETSP1175-20131217/16412_1 /TAXON_ID=1003142 /ORGANISM="Triceratium dubium, Strain CCMP147" /LENGTH=215 /DNA_ID=CAMNT_0042979845 /DNA_START=397 /DNA_END=1044 /DNA_ORIENTATION=-